MTQDKPSLKMNIQETSKQAYFSEVLPTLGERHQAVMKFLATVENATNTEISTGLGIPINAVTPRIHELRQKNLVIEACKRKCSQTGRTVIAWRIAKKTLAPENRRCNFCNKDAVTYDAILRPICPDHSLVAPSLF